MAVPGGTVYRGHDGARSWFRDVDDAFGGEFRVEPEVYFDLGEHTLGFFVLRARGRESGAQVAMPFAQVLKWRDGLVVYVKGYVHREDALRDLGVSEDGLEPIARDGAAPDGACCFSRERACHKAEAIYEKASPEGARRLPRAGPGVR